MAMDIMDTNRPVQLPLIDECPRSLIFDTSVSTNIKHIKYIKYQLSNSLWVCNFGPWPITDQSVIISEMYFGCPEDHQAMTPRNPFAESKGNSGG